MKIETILAYTQQYTDFNPLIEKYQSQGFTLIAFPCNQFYLQEPAENHELMNGIMYVRPGNGWKPHQNLHIYGKLDTNGDNQHPIYEFVKVSFRPLPPTSQGVISFIRFFTPRSNNKIICFGGRNWTQQKNGIVFSLHCQWSLLHSRPFGNHSSYFTLQESCPQTVDKIGKTDELMYNPIRASDITWNFEKFLIDRNGQPRFRFHPTAWSHGDVVIEMFIEQLLAEPATKARPQRIRI